MQQREADTHVTVLYIKCDIKCTFDVVLQMTERVALTDSVRGERLMKQERRRSVLSYSSTNTKRRKLGDSKYGLINYGAGPSRVQMPAWERAFYLLQNVQRCSGVHTASYSIGTWVLSWGEPAGT